MDRRAFLGTFALLAAPVCADAQLAQVRIGFLSPGAPSDPRVTLRFGAFRTGMRELGYVDGQNIAIETRWAGGKYERLAGLAAELVRLKVNVIVTYGPPAIQAAKEATGTIPIVMVAGVLVAGTTGLVASLSRPGGNLTGVTLMASELVAKQLELVKQVLPRVSRVALLGNPANAGTAPQVRQAREAARALGMHLDSLEASGPGEIDRAFAAMSRGQAGAVIVLVDGMLSDHRTRIADLAATRRLPVVYGLTDDVEVGGLIAYGASVAGSMRRLATYVDKILRGAKPGDLPVEQPTKFELVINLKTAKALGLTIPPSLLQRADQVIE